MRNCDASFWLAGLSRVTVGVLTGGIFLKDMQYKNRPYASDSASYATGSFATTFRNYIQLFSEAESPVTSHHLMLANHGNLKALFSRLQKVVAVPSRG